MPLRILWVCFSFVLNIYCSLFYFRNKNLKNLLLYCRHYIFPSLFIESKLSLFLRLLLNFKKIAGESRLVKDH